MRARVAIEISYLREADVCEALDRLNEVQDGSILPHQGNPQLTAVIYADNPRQYVWDKIVSIPGVVDANVLSSEVDSAITRDEMERERRRRSEEYDEKKS